MLKNYRYDALFFYLDLEKTIYEKVGYPPNKGVFEKAFMEYPEPWTDEKFYKKYNLTAEEIAFIKSMIRPMD